MNKQCYEIQKGYRFVEKYQKMDVWQARDILLSKKQRFILNMAVYEGENKEEELVDLFEKMHRMKLTNQEELDLYFNQKIVINAKYVASKENIQYENTQISINDSDFISYEEYQAFFSCKSLVVSHFANTVIKLFTFKY